MTVPRYACTWRAFHHTGHFISPGWRLADDFQGAADKSGADLDCLQAGDNTHIPDPSETRLIAVDNLSYPGTVLPRARLSTHGRPGH
jgi:hypothetical protein